MKKEQYFAVSEEGLRALMTYLQSQPIKDYNKVKPILDILVQAKLVKIQDEEAPKEPEQV